MVPADIGPLVSVVIPAFNAASTLGETLDSVISQTCGDTEIIVVDDGSSDGTPELLERYRHRVRSVRQANRGLAAARNAGARLAVGEFVALMDADDLCMPERLALQVQALQRCPDAVLCCSDFSALKSAAVTSPSYERTYYSCIDEAGGLSSLFPHHETGYFRLGSDSDASVSVEVHRGRVYEALVFGNFVHPPTVMVRAAALRAAGLFDEALRYNSDWECFVRMSRLGDVVHLGRPLLAYRISDAQMSSSRGNHGEGAADLVRTAEKIWRADPSLVVSSAPLVRNCRREFYAHAARSLAEHSKFRSARMLAWSVWYGASRQEALNTALKLLLPARLTRYARRRMQLGR